MNDPAFRGVVGDIATAGVMASSLRLRRRSRLLRLLLFGVFRPDAYGDLKGCRSCIFSSRRYSSVGGGVLNDVDEARLISHDWPLLSREPSVNANPVWTSQSGSAFRVLIWRCRFRADFFTGGMFPPKP